MKSMDSSSHIHGSADIPVEISKDSHQIDSNSQSNSISHARKRIRIEGEMERIEESESGKLDDKYVMKNKDDYAEGKNDEGDDEEGEGDEGDDDEDNESDEEEEVSVLSIRK